MYFLFLMGIIYFCWGFGNTVGRSSGGWHPVMSPWRGRRKKFDNVFNIEQTVLFSRSIPLVSRNLYLARTFNVQPLANSRLKVVLRRRRPPVVQCDCAHSASHHSGTVCVCHCGDCRMAGGVVQLRNLKLIYNKYFAEESIYISTYIAAIHVQFIYHATYCTMYVSFISVKCMFTKRSP